MSKKKRTDPVHDIDIPIPHDPRIFKIQVKRDIRLFDEYILRHTGDKKMKLYQLKSASAMIYIQRHKIQKSLESWMRDEGCYTEQEIQKWSHPVYEWKEAKATPEQLKVIQEWRKKYQIKDDYDWSQGIRLSEDDKRKLDKYKQISVLQPRQSGKSEVVVRVNIYTFTIVHHFKASVFAPTEDQAKDFIFQRTRDYIEEHPAYKGRFKTLNALDMTLYGPEAEDVGRRASGSSFAASSASPGANIEGDTLDWAIIDESQDVTDYKVKKSIKYMMAATGGAMIKIGTVNTVKGHFHESTTKKGEKFWHQVIIYPDIVAAERPDWAEFIANAIEEEGRHSDTVRMSIFLEWLLEIGMFINEEQWESLVDPSLDWIEYDKTGLQFCLIDVAKSRDQTIAMVVKVDQTKVIDGRHPFQILNTMALLGVDYTSQYNQIKSWIDNNYNVAAVGVDDTGGRGGIADAFSHTSYRVEPFTYTRPGKSEWYTNLSTIINSQYSAAKQGRHHDKLIRIPGTPAARKEKQFREFEEQMMDLQKSYKNNYLVVHHPEIEGAHDDYPDVFMMAAWMASRVTISLDELEDAIEQIADTQMDQVDWSQDLFGSGPKTGGPKKKKAAASKDDDVLAQIISGSEDLSGPDW
jgi:hypothetical protein